MSRQKGKFLPVTIRFADGSSMIVSSICDAAKALDRKWHSKDCHLFLEAERLIAAARDGSCKPEVALQAFKSAAREQRLLRATKRTPVVSMFDEMTGSLF
ncbi:DUF982 domain-containing protein [Mesorhizobium sp. M00.F.Ca.ET.216.01.1.1]|uniref:DUF982 domain-containing protein n=1 Tax=Mesorhizobium sp. M00.F.Ca.ET.216.01.1.1 TaxID=2500528 RepID=UPI000FDB5679|nr:DUF982 domain-containing protein [Mesorhizobium sp. M00.F.Ca.ET.216.01.1.1]TGQ34612.1 DUF982 domain-containing protein [Mesorhizobium sp. M00.F.Ca.ET.216.01.1.1]TJW09309.1 MAG: DUF982 domain-containing protein [Mesorhizobium sp.]